VQALDEEENQRKESANKSKFEVTYHLSSWWRKPSWESKARFDDKKWW